MNYKRSFSIALFVSQRVTCAIEWSISILRRTFFSRGNTRYAHAKCASPFDEHGHRANLGEALAKQKNNDFGIRVCLKIVYIPNEIAI
jgi:hypothetical protein